MAAPQAPRRRQPRCLRLLIPVLVGLASPELAQAAVQPALPTDPAELLAACRKARQADRTDLLRKLRQRLLQVAQPPQPFPVVLAASEALLECQAPTAALQALASYGPAPGSQRRQWLVQQWRAASAGLEHDRAARALFRLRTLEGIDLESFTLPVGRPGADGAFRQRPALDLLVDNLEALGRNQEAAALLLATRLPGEARARRLRRAVLLQPQTPLAERDRWLESALEEAAAAGAWSLATDLLDDQVLLHLQAGEDPSRAVERRVRLSRRLDDAYGEWRLRRHDPRDSPRTTALEQQLRSPAAPGGHAVAPVPRSPLP